MEREKENRSSCEVTCSGWRGEGRERKKRRERKRGLCNLSDEMVLFRTYNSDTLNGESMSPMCSATKSERKCAWLHRFFTLEWIRT